MNIFFVLSLIMIAVSIIFALANEFIFFGIATTLLAIAVFVFHLRQRSNINEAVVFAFFALGLSSLYLSTYLWVFGNEFDLTSDAYLYDRVAQDIAYTIPWYSQLNLFSYSYVDNIAQAYGYVINHAGFYKILGIFYSLGDLLNINALSIQISAVINCASYLIIGAAFYKILMLVGVSSQIRWFLSYAFLTSPILIREISTLHKDLFLLAVTLLTFVLIIKRHKAVTFFLVFFIATIRLPQAALLLILFLIYEVNLRNYKLLNFVRKKYFIISALALISPFVVMLYLSNFEIADESLNALMQDQEKASSGFSTYLSTNVIGAALYGIFYPFPNLLPSDFLSLINTIYAYIYIFIFIFIVMKSKLFDHSAALINAVFVLFIIAYAVYAFAAALSWKAIGFVVFEARYKFLGIVCMFVLFGHLMSVYFLKKKNENLDHQMNVSAPRGGDVHSKNS